MLSKRLIRTAHSLLSRSIQTQFSPEPLGEIPDALLFDHPKIFRDFQGVRLVTEPYESKLGSLTVLVKAGSRYFTKQPASAFYTSQLFLNDEKLNSLRSEYCFDTSSEVTKDTISFTINYTEPAPKLLEEFLNSVFQASFQAENFKKQVLEIYNQSLQSEKFLIETAAHVSYGSKSIGTSPSYVSKSIEAIKKIDIDTYRKAFFSSDRVVMSSAGLESKEVIEKCLEFLPKFLIPTSKLTYIKPVFNPGPLMIPDTSKDNIDIAIFSEAPSLSDTDSITFKLFPYLFGGYSHTPDSYIEQSDSLKKALRTMKDVHKARGYYLAGEDYGMVGFVISCMEYAVPWPAIECIRTVKKLGYEVKDDQLRTAKTRYYRDLIENDSTEDRAKVNAEDMMMYGRIIPRTEKATKIAELKKNKIRDVFGEWATKAFLTVVAHGQIHTDLGTLSEYKGYSSD
jgi:predicted Zn-dependent peptidase